MRPKLLALHSRFARDVAKLSSCDRTQVGALLLTPDGEQVLAFGYNGGVRGGDNQPLIDHPGTDFWVHAEMNALCKSRPDKPFVCLTTHTPCVACAKLLVNSGCLAVYALERYRDSAGWQLLENHGVQIFGLWEDECTDPAG